MKKFTSVILLAVILASTAAVPVYAYEPPAKIWTSFNEYAKALEASDYQNIIKYGLIDVGILEGEPVNETTQNWLCARYQNIANAYEMLGDYEKSSEMYKKQIPLAKKIGWVDSAKIAQAKSEQYASGVELYQKVYGKTKYYGAINEPEQGVYFGMSADSRTNKDACSAKLIYIEFGDTNFDWIRSELKKANEKKQAVEIALNLPNQGNDIQRVLNSTDYINSVAQLLLGYPNIKFFVRFGAEFDIWETPADAASYKSAFRKVADIIHYNVKNAAMVFSPNMVSSWDIDVNDYYPGDEYVDWVGMSLYMMKYFQGVKDRDSETKYLEAVFKTGDSATPVLGAKKLVELYGGRKPIIISEGGVSHYVRTVNEDNTQWAKNRLKQTYTYLPMVYPQIKMMMYFDTVISGEINDYALTSNSEISSLYSSLTSGDMFIKKTAAKNGIASYKQLQDTIYSDGNPLEISAYAHIFGQDEVKVNYYIDGNWTGAASEMPYEKTFDMSAYSSGEHILNVSVEANGTEVYSRKYKIVINKPEQDIKVSVNGDFVEFKQPPVILGGRTLVPLREIFVALGADVEWDDVTRTAIAKKGNETMRISIGSNELYISGNVEELDVPAKLINEKTMVPARAVSEAFNATVGWDNETRTVVINYND